MASKLKNILHATVAAGVIGYVVVMPSISIIDYVKKLNDSANRTVDQLETITDTFKEAYAGIGSIYLQGELARSQNLEHYTRENHDIVPNHAQHEH